MRNLLVASVAGALAVLLAAPAPAAACSPVYNEPWQSDPAFADDLTAPSPPRAEPATIYRADTATGCGFTSCGGGGSVAVNLDATDDRADPNRLGYLLTLRSGTLPPGLVLPTEPLRSVGAIFLFFDEEAGNFGFELEARTVDLNGNRSAPITITVVDDSQDDGGCTAAPAGADRRGLGLVLVGLALALAVRPRRRRHNPARTGAMR